MIARFVTAMTGGMGKLQWYHWATLSILIICGTILIATGHLSPEQLGTWLMGLTGLTR